MMWYTISFITSDKLSNKANLPLWDEVRLWGQENLTDTPDEINSQIFIESCSEFLNGQTETTTYVTGGKFKKETDALAFKMRWL